MLNDLLYIEGLKDYLFRYINLYLLILELFVLY
jgi:hypothetical protein